MSIEACCPEHNIIHTVHKDYEILVHNNIRTCGSHINCYQIQKVAEWYKLIKTIISNNAMHQYMYGDFCNHGQCSDSFLITAIDLISTYNVCCCPDKIRAYCTLDINIGLDICKLLKHAISPECDIDDSEFKQQIDYPSDAIKFLKKCSKSFIHFIITDMNAPQYRTTLNMLELHNLVKKYTDDIVHTVPPKRLLNDTMSICDIKIIKEIKKFQLTLTDKLEINKYNKIIEKIEKICTY